MDAARRRGAKIGRPRVTFDLDAARASIAEGEPISVVARAHGVGASTLRRAMRSTCADVHGLDLVDAAE